MTKRKAGESRRARGLALAPAGVLLVASLAQAAADPCLPPAWLKILSLRRSAGELIGSGKGPTEDKAARAARRVIAAKLMGQHAAEILALPSVKPALNRKAYTDAELAQALTLAVAFNILDPKPLNAEVVCDTAYVALAVKTQVVLSTLKTEPDLGTQMNLALTNRIDALEDRTAEQHAAEAQSQQESARQGALRGLAGPNETVRRLRLLAPTLDEDELLESQLRLALRRSADRLASDAGAAAALELPAAIAKAAADLLAPARDAEKLLAATRLVHAKNYVRAFEALSGMATAGDDVAQFAVGYMRTQALGTKRDYREALVWLRRAAAQNHGPAKMLIGILLFSGHGDKANTAEAIRWIQSAAEDGWTCEADVTMCRKR